MSTHILTAEEIQILEEAHQKECQEMEEELLADAVKNVVFEDDGTAIEYDENGEILCIWF